MSSGELQRQSDATAPPSTTAQRQHTDGLALQMLPLIARLAVFHDGEVLNPKGQTRQQRHFDEGATRPTRDTTARASAVHVCFSAGAPRLGTGTGMMCCLFFA